MKHKSSLTEKLLKEWDKDDTFNAIGAAATIAGTGLTMYSAYRDYKDSNKPWDKKKKKANSKKQGNKKGLRKRGGKGSREGNGGEEPRDSDGKWTK